MSETDAGCTELTSIAWDYFLKKYCKCAVHDHMQLFKIKMLVQFLGVELYGYGSCACNRKAPDRLCRSTPLNPMVEKESWA